MNFAFQILANLCAKIMTIIADVAGNLEKFARQQVTNWNKVQLLFKVETGKMNERRQPVSVARLSMFHIDRLIG